METKICSRCKTEFPATNEYFNKEKSGRLGLKAECKICQRKRVSQYRKENVDRLRKQVMTRYYDPTSGVRERNLAYAKKYYREHKEKIEERRKKNFLKKRLGYDYVPKTKKEDQ